MDRLRIDLMAPGALDASPYFGVTHPVEPVTPTVVLLPPGVDPEVAQAIVSAPAPGVADLSALTGQPIPTLADADPVEAALRAQHAAWKLRDALSLADWLRFMRGYAVMLRAWDRGAP